MDTLKYIYINRKILSPNYLRIKARQIGCSTFASCLAPLEVEALKINPQKSQSAFSHVCWIDPIKNWYHNLSITVLAFEDI